MELLHLFRSLDCADSSSKHHRQGWINVKCPYCRSSHYHLGYNIKHGYFNCWQCGKKPLFETFEILLGVTPTEAKKLINEAKTSQKTGIFKTGTTQNTKPFEVPTGLMPLKKLKLHKKYLIKRGLDWKELNDKYGVRGTAMSSTLDGIDFSWRLYFPIKQTNSKGEQELVTWQTRSIGKSKLPYLACPKEREIINIKRTLYPIETSQKVVLVEGIFDVFKVRKAGFPAITGFGVGLKPKQISQLKDKRVIIMYDGDFAGTQEGAKINDRIQFIGGKIEIVKIPKGTDPGKLSLFRIQKLLKPHF